MSATLDLLYAQLRFISIVLVNSAAANVIGIRRDPEYAKPRWQHQDWLRCKRVGGQNTVGLRLLASHFKPSHSSRGNGR